MDTTGCASCARARAVSVWCVWCAWMFLFLLRQRLRQRLNTQWLDSRQTKPLCFKSTFACTKLMTTILCLYYTNLWGLNWTQCRLCCFFSSSLLGNRSAEWRELLSGCNEHGILGFRSFWFGLVSSGGSGFKYIWHCEGESPSRAKQNTWKMKKKHSKKLI